MRGSLSRESQGRGCPELQPSRRQGCFVPTAAPSLLPLFGSTPVQPVLPVDQDHLFAQALPPSLSPTCRAATMAPLGASCMHGWASSSDHPVDPRPLQGSVTLESGPGSDLRPPGPQEMALTPPSLVSLPSSQPASTVRASHPASASPGRQPLGARLQPAMPAAVGRPVALRPQHRAPSGSCPCAHSHRHHPGHLHLLP